jgi:hypothetical protein
LIEQSDRLQQNEVRVEIVVASVYKRLGWALNAKDTELTPRTLFVFTAAMVFTYVVSVLWRAVYRRCGRRITTDL